MKQTRIHTGLAALGGEFKSIGNNPTARPCVARLALLLICFTTGLAHALETDQTANWTTQTLTYQYQVPVPYQGDTISSNLVSNDFGFTITPGNYQVEINQAYFDDNGSVGGVDAPPAENSNWPHTPILDEDAPAVSITPDGRHLSVDITAIDAYGVDYGWVGVVITWQAKAGCSACTANSCPAGTADCSLDSINFKMGLGKDAYQLNAGQLVIETNYPSPILATPNGLQAYLGATTEPIYDNGTGMLRQVRTSQLLADIIVSNDFCYSVSFYAASNFSPVKVSGLYPPTGPPYNVVTVQNPDASTNTYNRLWISETGELGDHQYDYTWDPGLQQWALASGGGLRTETRSESWDSTGTILTETNVVLNTDNTIAFKQVQTYQVFPWGITNLVLQVVDPDGPMPETNTWMFYTNPITDGGNYEQLEQITDPSGYWERYEYDSSSRMTNKVAQFEDAPIDATDSQCRVTSYSYDSSNGQLVTTTVQTLLGQEIARSYNVDFPGGVSNIVCQSPGAPIDAPDNLVTVTLSYTAGSFQGQTWMTQNPDGTASLYQYATNATSMTTAEFSGAVDSTGTNVVDGTESISVVGLNGNAISNATYDIVSGLLLSSSWTVQTDDLGRPSVIQYNDGTTETNQYSCCGLESQTDRQGDITSYTYDDLKRVSTVARVGITTLYTYDAKGRMLTTTRQGTDGSQILQNVSIYDAGGTLLNSTNALNFGTTYNQTVDTNGDTVKTTTNPDGSTTIETDAQDNSQLSLTGTAVQGIRYAYGVEVPPGENVYRAYTQQIKLNPDGSDTGEWTKTYTDMAGRTYKTVYASAAGSPATMSYYNYQGQLVKQVDPDGVTTLYLYNAKGQVAYTAVDMNGNGLIDFAGADRITYTVSDVTNDYGVCANRTRTYDWATNNLDASNLVSSVETSANGLQSWNVTYNSGVGITNHSLTTYLGGGCIVVTNIAPDGSYIVATNLNGKVISAIQNDANGAQVGQTIYGYDVQGRQITANDARNGTTTFFFNNADQVIASLTPSPDGVRTGQSITNILDSMGRVVTTILPDATSVTNIYYPNGLLEETCGSRTYPVAYTYDYAGRMKTMTTWTNFGRSTGAADTTWNYDTQRGFLTSKSYADGKGPTYAYTPGGRLLARNWARDVTTIYVYDNAGDLSEVRYSDFTHPLKYGFDRLGRQVAVTNGATVCHWIYNDANEPLSESYIGGPLNGLTVTNAYDSLLRRRNLSTLNASSATLTSATYGYDAVSRFSTVSDGTNTAAYTYIANSPLVSDIAFAHNSQTVMTTTKQYDYLNRLTAIQNSVGNLSAASFNYNYNTANQRTAVTNADNSYWIYQYNSLGQVVSGKKYWSDGTPVAGQQFMYNFDDIGNRQSTSFGGDQTGSNLRSANYAVNSLNQITSRDVAGYVDVLGSANSNATLTVNLQLAYRHNDYFQDELSVNNSSSAQWLSLTNLAALNNGTNADIIATNTGNLYVAQTPEIFSYDADGNLTNDGRWSYVWDAENRLIQMRVNTNVGTQYELAFVYDSQGRRIQKIVATNGVSVYTNNFLYDGWNLIAVLTPDSGLEKAFMWDSGGSDSTNSGSDVGGLISMTSYSNTNLDSYFCAYDGNNDVAELVSATDGVIMAQYEYNPFGEVIRQTGPMAEINPFRFSTKYQDDETGLYYYGYRYYDVITGRWFSRDPLEEGGGDNLYEFVDNDPINQVDLLGLTIVESSHWFPGSIPNGCIYIRTMDDGQSLNIVTLRHLTEGDISSEEAVLRNRLAIYKKEWGKPTRAMESGFDTKWFQGVGADRQYYWVKGQNDIYADDEINYIGIGMYEAWYGDSYLEAESITWIWKLQYPGPIPPGTWFWLGRGYDDYLFQSGAPPNSPSQQPQSQARR